MPRPLAAVALALILGTAPTADARRESVYRYPFSRVWSSALRMLRVDYESPITEKDIDSGYFLFEFPEGGKTHSGSVEIARTGEGDADTVRVVVQVPSLPSYVEQMMLDRLTRKLNEEFGEPAAPKKPDEGNDAPPSERAPDSTKPKEPEASKPDAPAEPAPSEPKR